MTPENFRTFVEQIAADNGFPTERIILAGDHLGPTGAARGRGALAGAGRLLARHQAHVHGAEAQPAPGLHDRS
jgi:tagatose-1,6-bisphosphate aldolase non-catalytic subunit AgaZ/GatZ